MEFSDLINLRQSDRKYIRKRIDNKGINKILKAAQIAPSASNSQPWTFVVVQEENLRDKVAHLTYGPLKSFNKFVPQADVIIAIVQEKKKFITEIGGRIKGKDYALIDIGIAAEHICLQATEMGIGSCMLGWFDEVKIKKLLNVPDERNIPLLITLGYVPDDYPHRKKVRKDFDDIVKFNSY